MFYSHLDVYNVCGRREEEGNNYPLALYLTPVIFAFLNVIAVMLHTVIFSGSLDAEG